MALARTMIVVATPAAPGLSAVPTQARSELRFWRGAEVDKVLNPKQLYVTNLEKVRKIVSF